MWECPPALSPRNARPRKWHTGHLSFNERSAGAHIIDCHVAAFRKLGFGCEWQKWGRKPTDSFAPHSGRSDGPFDFLKAVGPVTISSAARAGWFADGLLLIPNRQKPPLAAERQPHLKRAAIDEEFDADCIDPLRSGA